MEKSTDLGLLRLWQETRDAEAFQNLVERYAPLVHRTCLRVLGNRADAEEIAQECFLRLAETPERVRTSLAGFLHHLALGLAKNRVTSDTRRRQREQRAAQNCPRGETAIPAREVTWAEVKRQVDEAIDQLPESMREIVVARYLLQQSLPSIATALGLSERQVRYRAQQGIAKVRARLRDLGLAIAAGAVIAGLARDATAAPTSLLADLGLRSVAGDIVHPVSSMEVRASSKVESAGPLVGLAEGTLVMKKALLAVIPVLLLATGYLWITASNSTAPNQPHSDQANLTHPQTPEVTLHEELRGPAHVLAVRVIWQHSQQAVTGGRIILSADSPNSEPISMEMEADSTWIQIPTGWSTATVALDHPEAYAEPLSVTLPRREKVVVIADTARYLLGEVTSAVSGAPIPDAQLRLFVTPTSPAFDSTTTTSEGEYELAVPAPGEVAVRASAPGFATTRATIRVTERNESILDLSLVPAGSLRFRVLDKSRSPLEGVRIRRSRKAGWDVDKLWSEGEVFTDKDGRATFRDLSQSDPHWLGFTLAGYEDNEYRHGRPLDETSLEQEIVIELRKIPTSQPTRALVGVVSDAQGAPIAGAQIRVRPSTRPPRDAARGFDSGATTQSNELGEYRVEFGDNDEYCVLAIAAAGHSPIVRPRVLSGTLAEPAHCDVRLPDSNWLSGQIVDEDGTAIAGARVKVSAMLYGSADAYPETQSTATTDELGRFHLSDLSPSLGRIEVSPPEGMRAHWRRPEDIAVNTEVKFVLVGVGKIRGRVIDAESGDPIPSFTVRRRPDNWDWETFEPLAFTADDGRFEITDLARHRTWSLRVAAPGYLDSQFLEVEVARDPNPGDELIVELRRGAERRVRVLAAESGTPIAGAKVIFYVPETQIVWQPEWQRVQLHYQELETDPNGHASYLELAQGVLQIRAPGRRRLTLTGDDRNRIASRAEPLEVALPAGEVLRLSYNNDAEGARPWAVLHQLPSQTQLTSSKGNERRTIGSVSFEDRDHASWDDLAPGHYLLEVRLGFTQARRRFELKNSQVLQIDLNADWSGASLHGQLRDQLGNLPGDCEVILRPTTPSPWSEFSAWVSAMNDGRFRFDRLPSGTFTVHAEFPTKVIELGSLTLQGATESSLTLP